MFALIAAQPKKAAACAVLQWVEVESVMMPRRSLGRRCQFDTMRLRLIKFAVRIGTHSKSIRLHLPRSSPDQAILAYALAKLPRLVT